MNHDITKKQFDRAHSVLAGRLKGIIDHPAFKYSFENEGYKNHTFGGRAGPSYNIDNVFHEIAHAIEFIKSGYIAEDRALYGSFQFIIKYHEFFQIV